MQAAKRAYPRPALHQPVDVKKRKLSDPITSNADVSKSRPSLTLRHQLQQHSIMQSSNAVFQLQQQQVARLLQPLQSSQQDIEQSMLNNSEPNLESHSDVILRQVNTERDCEDAAKAESLSMNSGMVSVVCVTSANS